MPAPAECNPREIPFSLTEHMTTLLRDVATEFIHQLGPVAAIDIRMPHLPQCECCHQGTDML